MLMISQASSEIHWCGLKLEWYTTDLDFELVPDLTVGEMEKGRNFFRHAELHWPILQESGYDGHVRCQAFLDSLQFLSESRIARSSGYPYFLAHMARISWM